MARLNEIVAYANALLEIDRFKDYAPNGLQIEGKANVKKIVTGVTASLALVEAAIEQGADMLLVHHGYFWKGENPCIVGGKGRRITALIKNEISLAGYHLPLDAHPEFGNNACLARLLGITAEGAMDEQGVGNYGVLDQAVSLQDFEERVAKVLGRQPLVIRAGEHPIKRIAWCSGGAQKYIETASSLGVDAYLSGEISESTVHTSRESGVHYIAAGHHATERYGIQALGEHLADHFVLEYEFIDIDNPA
jgi:dinuclear metal center YbgI/SA1388 family protein